MVFIMFSSAVNAFASFCVPHTRQYLSCSAISDPQFLHILWFMVRIISFFPQYFLYANTRFVRVKIPCMHLGPEYHDYNIVLSLPNGRPMEGQVVSRAFKKLIKKNDLPDVVFHSLRHSSTTYKLKINNGDIKSVQGDTGHAEPKMVTEVYSHIIDEDRRHNATKFEREFYSGYEAPKQNAADTAEMIISLLKATPEVANELMQMLAKGGLAGVNAG